jgi:hypothetical protein
MLDVILNRDVIVCGTNHESPEQIAEGNDAGLTPSQ